MVCCVMAMAVMSGLLKLRRVLRGGRAEASTAFAPPARYGAETVEPAERAQRAEVAA